MLAAASLWTVVVATEQAAQLRHDLLPAIFYVSNWAQIFGDVPYFSPAEPVLRHLWSLAVEEQWYLLWPLLFIGLRALLRGRARVMAVVLALVAAKKAGINREKSIVWIGIRNLNRSGFK
jgi:peptidoglycan/LPS O-acetylase OafA/YrhL